MIELEAKNNAWVIWVYFLLFKGEKYIQKSLQNLDHRVLRKNQVDTHVAPVFAPDYSATGLADKKWTNSQCPF